MAELYLDKTETALLMADQRKPWTSWVTQSLSGLLRLSGGTGAAQRLFGWSAKSCR